MGTRIPLAIGMAGTALSWLGAGWDISWHRMFGRDTFWSTPHLFIYTGVALWGIAALVATATAMSGRPIRGRPMQIGPFRAELGLALIGFGAIGILRQGRLPADLAAHATPITDPETRRAVLTRILANINRSDQLETWLAESPLVRVTFDEA